MEIKTKFNVGDKVTTIYLKVCEGKQEGKYCIDHNDYIVESIFIRVDELGTDIGYKLTNGRFVYFNQNEGLCFKNFKQAQAECDKRNKGE